MTTPYYRPPAFVYGGAIIFPGYYEDVFRNELLEKARSTNKHGLLICEECGWVWLAMETARINGSSDGLGVVCLELNDCMRRRFMNMKVFVPSARSKNGKFYDFTTGRRATPICSYDTITGTGIVRGDQCHCHLPKHN